MTPDSLALHMRHMFKVSRISDVNPSEFKEENKELIPSYYM